MLQQILRDMYVDPELLAELDETQKQTLFCKMREEQVRRWRIWDQKLTKEKDEEHTKCLDGTGRSVQFLQGEDGEPWVWVMGEHRDDKSIETILLEEAKQKAQRLALKEAEQLRKSVERELTQLIDYQPLDSMEQKFDISPKQTDLEDAMEIYCTVDELRERMQAMSPELTMQGERIDEELIKIDDDKIEYRNGKNKENSLHFNFIEGKRDVLQEIGITAGGGGDGGVSNRVAAWERRVAAARAGEILRGLRQRRARQARDAEQLAHHHDLTWREQERKAKEAEQQMREIARAAREEHRRTSVMSDCRQQQRDENCYSDTFLSLAGKPPNRDAIVDWFRLKEVQRGAGLDETGQPAEWFHGLITRSEAEGILMSQPEGSFLVRVSERIWGYAISYRAPDRCKHYLVDATRTRHYQFLGDNQISHDSLAELVRYHNTHAITESGGELLVRACAAPHPAILHLAHA